MRNHKFPFRLETAAPCSQDWAEMTGSGKQRHCVSCNKSVFNFAGMTANEIERLITESKGSLCARIMRRKDGSLVTLDSTPRPSLIAGFVASTSLLLSGSILHGQSSSASQTGAAYLNGHVLTPNGSGAVAGAMVRLEKEGALVAEVKTDENGAFSVSAPVGTYDVVIRQNAIFGARIREASLHEGEQSLQPLKTYVDMGNGEAMTTVGELVSTYRYPMSYVFKHPLRYLKHVLS